MNTELIPLKTNTQHEKKQVSSRRNSMDLNKNNLVELKKTNLNRKKTVLVRWGWGILFLAELLLGDIFVNDNKSQSILLFGFFFLIIGVLLVSVPFLVFPKKGEIPKGENFLHTTVIIDTGIYSMVRHPQYLGWAFLIFSLALIRQHFIITVLGLIALYLLNLMTKEEEKDLFGKFGFEYEQYIKRVPRWNLPLGILHYFLRKKGMR